MKTKLYQVRDPAGDNSLLMVAPMTTIAQAFGLRHQAVSRVEEELQNPMGVSTCHFNGKSTPVHTLGGFIAIANFDAGRLA